MVAAADLDRPADLTARNLNTKAVEPLAFATLRAALREAQRALRGPDLQPWITTAYCGILKPA
ncbi:MAG: hypothetical protein K2X71_04235 [Methylobacterium sp.]|uniref:hypothetical protein n=1 Tax=Methylobacterium sp. TaxID=409 RepID=UPI0025849FDD|nr:hypothetical protein [Methylobacterium sp.]MBY0295239.1 hypothetical protein [Methylobacterium sp.]